MSVLPSKNFGGVELNKSVVWFVPAERVLDGVGLILKNSGFFSQVKPRKRVGIKVHFGEAGNSNHLDPEIVRRVVITTSYYDLQPVLIETTSLYRGRRQRAAEHIKLAQEHGFSVSRVLAPIEILDGEFGEKFYTVNFGPGLAGQAYLASGLRYYRYLINLAHFKGHFVVGFGGALKNLAMGLAAKAGKLAMHSSSKPYVDEEKCASCGTCIDYCPHDAISFRQYVASIGRACTGCGGCVAVCPYGAIKLNWDAASDSVQQKMADYCRAILSGRVAIHFNFALKITPNCDCYPQTEQPIVPDIGVFASLDPVACDQAVLDRLENNIRKLYPHINPGILLARAEEIGLGQRDYELITM
uniref:DUF362 domain-containing protein n=1 Tax=candidate division WOR-3 bacterium TaxID=2052148 RepID=A0A7V3PU18_UNCW3